MQNRSWNMSGLLAAVLCAGMLAATARDAHAAINVGITPATATVQAGSEFDVFLDITSAGSAFNGFSVVLSYNPAVLTLLPTVPSSLQEGCLMTGGCSAACGNTFHEFIAAGDSIAVNDYLFCNQITLSAPGHLYRLRFRAPVTAQTTSISIRRATFYNAGLLVNPVNTANTTIQIPQSLGVGDDIAALRTLRVEPNPAFGRLQLVLEDGKSGLAQIDIMDLQGRVVRHWGPVWLGPHARVEWNGIDSAGKQAAGGLYLARIQRGTQIQTSHFVLLR